MNCIDEMPAADVEPVKHGKWINKGNAMCACIGNSFDNPEPLKGDTNKE